MDSALWTFHIIHIKEVPHTQGSDLGLDTG